MKKQIIFSLISLLVISGCKNIISSTSKESSKVSSNIINSSVISSSSEYIMPTTEEEMFLEVKKALDYRRTYEGDITIEVKDFYSSYSKNQNEESTYIQNSYETYSISNDGRRYSMNALEQSDNTSSIKQVMKEKEYFENNEIVLGDYIYVDEFYLDDKLVSYEDTLVLEKQKIYKAFYYDEYNDDNMGLNSFGLIY